MTLHVFAPDIQCEGCAQSIKRSLGKLSGIQEVVVDIASKQVTVVYDPTLVNDESIRARFDAAGFPLSGANSIPPRA